jgi:hypothetical protein
MMCLVGLVGTSCATTSTPPGDVPSEGVAASGSGAALPAITLRRTGGIAGVSDTVTVDPGGAWTATDKAGRRRTGRLTADQIAQVRALAVDPRLAAEARRSPGPSRCQDAFQYAVTAGATTVTYVDCPSDERPPAAEALVAALRTAAR